MKTQEEKRGVHQEISLRKARTRTIIQAGGLIEKARLFTLLDLEMGQDLQRDPEAFDGVAVLMGALLSIQQDLLGEHASAQKLIWKNRGKDALARKE